MADDLPEGPALLCLCVQQLQIWALPIIGQEPARRVIGHGAVVVGVAVVRVDDHASRVGAAHGGDQLPAVGHWEGGEGKRNLKTETHEGKRQLEGGKRRAKEKLLWEKLEGKRNLREESEVRKRNFSGKSLKEREA